MMALEIVGGVLFGSLALVADGLHMSTHAGALLLAALAYTYARRHAGDRRFTFGTGKLGDLAGFTSAVVLAMIAILIGYEASTRLFAPVAIHFGEAIPIAVLGLGVNVASAWLLAGGHHPAHGHDHSHHAHSHEHGSAHAHDVEHTIATPQGRLVLCVFEDAHPPVFRLRAETGPAPVADTVTIETMRPDGTRQIFPMESRGNYLQSQQEIPEPHAFTAVVRLGPEVHSVVFEEHDHPAGAEHGAAHRDNNMRAAIVHVMADAAVSVLVIVGLLLARGFGWLWMDPLAGLVGAVVIASWSYSLIKDTGAILLDMCPDREVEQEIRRTVEAGGDRLNDLHVWRLGPGHLGAILSVTTRQARDPGYYQQRLARLRARSHVTVEVLRAA
jgi:cation diffusion facilitator family transporter